MFRRKGTTTSGSPDGIYDVLRTRALHVTEAMIGKAPPDHPQVLGAVIDIPSEGGTASLVAMADGATSLYTSTGSGTIGAGEHEAIAQKSRALLVNLQRRIELFPADDRMDVPPADLVQITVMTPTGRRRASIPAPAFWGEQPSTVIDLIASIHDVISGIRKVQSPT